LFVSVFTYYLFMCFSLLFLFRFVIVINYCYQPSALPTSTALPFAAAFWLFLFPVCGVSVCDFHVFPSAALCSFSGDFHLPTDFLPTFPNGRPLFCKIRRERAITIKKCGGGKIERWNYKCAGPKSSRNDLVNGTELRET